MYSTCGRDGTEGLDTVLCMSGTSHRRPRVPMNSMYSTCGRDETEVLDTVLCMSGTSHRHPRVSMYGTLGHDRTVCYV